MTRVSSCCHRDGERLPERQRHSPTRSSDLLPWKPNDVGKQKEGNNVCSCVTLAHNLNLCLPDLKTSKIKYIDSVMWNDAGRTELVFPMWTEGMWLEMHLSYLNLTETKWTETWNHGRGIRERGKNWGGDVHEWRHESTKTSENSSSRARTWMIAKREREREREHEKKWRASGDQKHALLTRKSKSTSSSQERGSGGGGRAELTPSYSTLPWRQKRKTCSCLMEINSFVFIFLINQI